MYLSKHSRHGLCEHESETVLTFTTILSHNSQRTIDSRSTVAFAWISLNTSGVKNPKTTSSGRARLQVVHAMHFFPIHAEYTRAFRQAYEQMRWLQGSI
jgi:hypothetical protein